MCCFALIFFLAKCTDSHGRGGAQQTGADEAFLVEAVSVKKTHGLREGLFRMRLNFTGFLLYFWQ